MNQRSHLNKREKGSLYEEKVVRFLQENGYLILKRNYRCPCGEIDIIAEEGRYLVFVEVKYRRNSSMGCGLEAVNFYKRNHISRTARWYLMQQMLPEDTPCRFDVVSVLSEKLSLIKNAFDIIR